MSLADDVMTAIEAAQTLADDVRENHPEEDSQTSIDEDYEAIAKILHMVQDGRLVPAPDEPERNPDIRYRVRMEVKDIHAERTYASQQLIAAEVAAQSQESLTGLLAYLGGGMGKAIGDQIGG